MSRPRILMFLSNAFRPDSRVKREAEGLVQAGFRVSLICWDRAAELAPTESVEGLEVIRVQDVRSRHGLGWKQLFRLPRFLGKAIRLATSLRPAAVHCHDLDTLFAGYELKKRLSCALVYDAHENYPALMKAYLPGLIVTGLQRLEKRLIRHADLTITASTVLRDELVAKGLRPVVTLGNYPCLNQFRAVASERITQAREDLGVPRERLLIAYIGGFSRNRALLPFIHAAGLLPDVEFHVWGNGHQRAHVEAAAAHFQNAHYHGWLSAELLPLYFQAADIIYYGLKKDDASSPYNAPNTVAQAMASGTPVIGTDIGDLGRMIRETGAGILLDEATPEQIALKVEALHSSDLRREMGLRGLAAAVSEYNAGTIQKQLATFYEQLIEGNRS